MKEERITLKLPPENKWVPMLAETVRHYSSILDIPDVLCSMISESLIEGCEELIRLCIENKIDDHYEICLDFNSDAILIQIIFNGKIPLNPHKMENYEVPDEKDDLFDVNLEALWLHLIKRRMDRVFFKVEGNIQILQMMKYRRKAENPRQFWIMGLAPKLKPGIVLDIQENAEDSQKPKHAILQNQETGSVLKLDPVSTFVVQRMDGKNTFQEIYMDYIDSEGMISPQRLALIFEKFEQSGMIETVGEENEKSIFKKVFHKLVNPNFVIPGADKIVTLVYTCCSFLFNSMGFAILLLIGFSGIIPLTQNFDAFKDIIFQLGEFYYHRPLLLVLVYLCTLLIVIIHEFGHGLMCKHYGGHIGRMGLMFYLTMFVFYCDVSSAWNFQDKKRRIMVSVGGPLTTFAILGITLWLFGLYSGINSVQAIFWGTLSYFCLFGLVMNINPFIKMDAYYVLMDLTGINNLRTRSFQVIKEIFVRSEQEHKSPNHHEKRVLWSYGIVGILITALFIILPVFYYSWKLLVDENTLNKLVFAIIIISLTLLRLSHKAFMSIRSRRRKTYKIA